VSKNLGIFFCIFIGYIYKMAKYAKRSYRKRSKKSTRKSSRRPRVSKSVKSYVKKTIHRMAENKCISTALNLNGNFFNATSNGWVTNNVYPLTFDDTVLICSQNNTQSGRVGNKVRVVKSTTKFCLTANTSNGTFNLYPQPVDVRVFIFSLKQEPIIGLNGSVSQFSALFQNGNSSYGPSTYITDQIADFNKDNFVIHYDKMVKVGNASNTGGGAVASSAYFANNDYKLNVMRKINTTKMLSKIYGWNDSNANPHSGKAVYIAFLPSLASGAVGTAGQQLFQIWFNTKIEYEDM